MGTLDGGGALFLAEQENLDDLLASIRSAHPNKAIILDVWATWCSPCVSDMQNSTENISKLRDMEVEVVYLCTTDGTNQSGWEKKVAELNLDATQIYMNDKLSRDIMETFNLSGYPSHILLNKEGKYVPDFHTRIATVDFKALAKKI